MHLLPLLPIILPFLPLTTTTAASLETQYTLTNTCARKTQPGDTIHVHYRGTLAADGTQFDASYDRGQPLRFTVGKGMVIKGWDEGLLEMCIGDRRTLTVPPELGYGDRGVGGIPGGATLVFETELMGIDGVENDGKDEL